MNKKRNYHSELRKKSKQITIETIIENTYKLHSEGITDIKTIAENSGVSVPTIRKYFPTNEDLFRGCANHFLKVNKLPEIFKYLDIQSFNEKVEAIVNDFYSFHEKTMESVWLSFRLAEQSIVMRNSTLQNEALIKAAVQVMLQDIIISELQSKEQLQGYIQGLLHPLFYKTLRTVSGLRKEQCINQTVKIILETIKGGENS
ncbi:MULTISPECIES: TetR/AcrR family transcriptional regulator [Neobacillus]|uniref:TetR/AcrR family transcriptional regulator n=1 Tax=Neobacillus rhizophilus TaxID=2833579 RepID=A0A942U9A9_9BACI|nr:MULTISPECIES: TetR/AcrR family transcriptional regulator [Neobacillus]MBS4214751.1 TetR/AcrR family transcriptional regulator [Neobacillus rhizophilus]